MTLPGLHAALQPAQEALRERLVGRFLESRIHRVDDLGPGEMVAEHGDVLVLQVTGMRHTQRPGVHRHPPVIGQHPDLPVLEVLVHRGERGEHVLRDSPFSSRSSASGPSLQFVCAWVATTPTPGRTYGHRDGTPKLPLAIPMPISPVVSQRPITVKVTSCHSFVSRTWVE